MLFLGILPIPFLSRSKNEGLSTHADPYSYVCNTAELPVFRTVPWTSNNGQSQALPAKRSHDSLQLCACGAVHIYCLRSKHLFKSLYIYLYTCDKFTKFIICMSHVHTMWHWRCHNIFLSISVHVVWLGHNIYLAMRCSRYIWQSSSTPSKTHLSHLISQKYSL